MCEFFFLEFGFWGVKPFFIFFLPPLKDNGVWSVFSPWLLGGGGVSSNISMLFYVSFGNISLKWRHHCRRLRAAKIRPVSGIYGICVDRDPCRATSAVTRGHGFGVLI